MALSHTKSGHIKLHFWLQLCGYIYVIIYMCGTQAVLCEHNKVSNYCKSSILRQVLSDYFQEKSFIFMMAYNCCVKTVFEICS